ncbi:MAG: hypothetical protein FJ041_04310 [Candidatus Cloacimonetes bacterium]|nr:hypothetical protein [Candidatus Cloacimonadota bacterium]
MSRYQEIDLSRLKRYNAKDRLSKVHESAFAKSNAVKLSDFWVQTPDILKAKDFKELLQICLTAYEKGKPIIYGIGGHVIKCGLAPLLIEMMKLRLCQGIACNGSVVIHDYEIACFGQTSEDVSTALEDGSFGMAADTADGINGIINNAFKEETGMGEAVGKSLANAPNKDKSLLAMAYQYNVPLTVHVALGTDIIHQHPSADGAAIGATSLRDFRIFCHNLINLEGGGVFINFGSAVVIPEVFLKAVSVVRNLGYPLIDFTTAVFDMNYQYRPAVNISQRPVQSRGKGFYFTGHHEIMIPLFLLSLKELINEV